MKKQTSLAAVVLSVALAACGGETAVVSEATSFPHQSESTDASFDVTVGACSAMKVADSDWQVGADVTDFELTALDDVSLDDETVATVTRTAELWKTDDMNLDPKGNVFTNDQTAHVLLVCGVRAGTTTLHVHRYDASDEIGTVLIRVGPA
ncbi:MAG TPA: hypothetical protein VIF62_31960 [Labilithrix sp.]